MPKALDLTGQKFGRLTVKKQAPSRSGKTYWICECDCGEEKEIQGTHLKTGAIKSCGCLQAETFKKNRSIKVMEFRRRIKIALVEAFGHKCHCCGLVDEPYIYDFHHIDPSQKDFQISGANTRSREKYLDEAKKCIMVCSNCHRKIEMGDIKQDFITVIDEDLYFATLYKLIST